MSRGAYLGEFGLMVLLALIRLSEGTYGVPICHEIEKRSGREAALGSLYAAWSGCSRRPRNFAANQRVGDSTAVRGGRAKRYFRVTAQGVRGVRQIQGLRPFPPSTS